ncbi:MAG TPA: phytanoyl-CoA dioxygenase family protein [Acidimicrobiales bacterium]|nr:phytanoyl-CoA dioxygenase family protein [Acidimicrobiales bacterium]
MSVDVRTRVDGSPVADDPAGFFGRRLPAALDAGGAALAAAAAVLDLAPLEVAVAGERWTLALEGGRVAVTAGPGGEGALRLALEPEQATDLEHDQVTPMGWFSSGRLALEGRLERLLDWWLVVRGALDGVVPHTGGSPTFTDQDGSPLDLGRSFAPDDDPGAMARFLEQTGFLHVTGVFGPDEMADVAADMDRAAPTYHPGDGRSWWARTDDGTQRLVRMQGFDAHSATVASFPGDARLARLGALTGDGHQWGGMEGNAIEALVKPIGVVEGISDVPWHKDCSLGRHSYECCSLTMGISVTGADATSGQLRVVAGSNRVLVWPALRKRHDPLPVVDLPTRTGDVTVHLSCTLHMAQPPVERERRVLYTGMRLPRPAPEAADAALRRLREVRERAAVTVSQPPAPARP